MSDPEKRTSEQPGICITMQGGNVKSACGNKGEEGWGLYTDKLKLGQCWVGVKKQRHSNGRVKPYFPNRQVFLAFLETSQIVESLYEGNSEIS